MDLFEILVRQLNSFWQVTSDEEALLKKYIPIAMEKTNESYGKSNRMYYLRYGFSPLNSTVYAVYLFFLANCVGKNTHSWGRLSEN